MEIEMTLKGLMIDPITNMPIVILKDKEGERVLPIWVGVFEANAIALQIENISTPRPMTHDLIRNILSEIEAESSGLVLRARCHPHESVRFGAVDAVVDELSRTLARQSPERLNAVAPRGLRALCRVFPVLGRVPFLQSHA